MCTSAWRTGQAPSHHHCMDRLAPFAGQLGRARGARAHSCMPSARRGMPPAQLWHSRRETPALLLLPPPVGVLAVLTCLPAPPVLPRRPSSRGARLLQEAPAGDQVDPVV